MFNSGRSWTIQTALISGHSEINEHAFHSAVRWPQVGRYKSRGQHILHIWAMKIKSLLNNSDKRKWRINIHFEFNTNFMNIVSCHYVWEKDSQCVYKCNIVARSRTYFYNGRAISIKYYVCVCVCLCVWGGTLIIQHAVRMRRIILSYVACLSLQHFPHYLIRGTILHKECHCT